MIAMLKKQSYTNRKNNSAISTLMQRGTLVVAVRSTMLSSNKNGEGHLFDLLNIYMKVSVLYNR